MAGVDGKGRPYDGATEMSYFDRSEHTDDNGTVNDQRDMERLGRVQVLVVSLSSVALGQCKTLTCLRENIQASTARWLHHHNRYVRNHILIRPKLTTKQLLHGHIP